MTFALPRTLPQPNGVAGEPCLELDQNNKLLNDLECHLAFPFYCEYDLETSVADVDGNFVTRVTTAKVCCCCCCC